MSTVTRSLARMVDGHEATLLSRFLNDGKAIEEYSDLKPEHFASPVHREIFQAILQLHYDGHCANFLALTDYFRRRNKLREIGEHTLSTLAGDSQIAAMDASCFGYALDCVLENWRQRRAGEIGKALHKGDIEISKAVELLSELDEPQHEDLPEGVPLMTLGAREPDLSKTLLGNRFLCRDGGMLFIGPSGIGKSSASAQQDILWALGRPAFGIKPSRRLRILCIQGENDDEDLGEMANGICGRLNLSQEERELVRKNVIYVSDCSHTGESFLQMVARLLEKYGPFDLLRIDTLHAYLGGDILDVEVTSRFLRNGLNPILKKFGCAVIVNHHTPKPTNRDTSNWRASDWMYSGAGNADVTNWCRAALIINSTHTPDVYEFHAAKRGKRIGWCDDICQTIYTRLFCWDKGEAIYWREATAEDAERVQLSKPQAATKRGMPRTKEDLKALVPPDGSVAKNVLIGWARDRGIGEKRAKGFLTELIEAGELFEWGEKRSRTRPELRISRHERKLI
jgi:hypothetical protein